MKAKLEGPLHVAWEITRRCNARCVHCSADAGPETVDPNEVTTGEARRIIDELADAGVRVIGFTGGEPLLRGDLAELIGHATGRGMSVSVCTNGALVDEGRALALRAAGLKSVTVSLDGACAETHDSMRGLHGLFDLALMAVRTLSRCHYRVSVSFTPTRVNYREVREAVALAHLLGADSFCLSQYIPTGRGTRELMLGPRLVGKLADDVIALRAQYSCRMQIYCHDCHVALALPDEEREGYRGCGAGVATAGICADTGVTPCVFMPNRVGNLRRESFDEIWSGSALLARLRDREQLKQGNCGSCRFKLVCGGCRAAAMAIHGDPMLGDPTCWMFPEAVEGVEPAMQR